MNDWTRRTIGPGRNRDAAPTQPLDDTQAAARVLGWLPSDVLADAVEQETADVVADGDTPRVLLLAVGVLSLSAVSGALYGLYRLAKWMMGYA